MFSYGIKILKSIVFRIFQQIRKMTIQRIFYKVLIYFQNFSAHYMWCWKIVFKKPDRRVASNTLWDMAAETLSLWMIYWRALNQNLDKVYCAEYFKGRYSIADSLIMSFVPANYSTVYNQIEISTHFCYLHYYLVLFQLRRALPLYIPQRVGISIFEVVTSFMFHNFLMSTPMKKSYREWVYIVLNNFYAL